MNCPACDRILKGLTVADVAIDVCRDGCGGLWFDQHELEKFDEPHEEAGAALLEIARAPDVVLDPAKRISCPLCDGTVLMRHFFSVKRKVEVDECPTCGGFWLDVGELRQIRSLFPSEEARRAAAQEYFDDVFGDRLGAMRAESQERLAKARRIAHMFRFICPTYYIPGKQEWGAF